MKILLFSILLFCMTEVGFGFGSFGGLGALFGRTPPPDEDCVWGAYQTSNDCLRLPGSNPPIYRRLFTRGKIKEKKGNGAECVGDSQKYEPCGEVEHYATTFKSTVLSATRNGGGSARRTFGTSQPNPVSTCVADVKDKKNRLRMLGKPCTPGRRKREIEVVFEETSANARSKRQVILSTKARDVLFLIDESGSVGSKNFQKFLDLAIALTNSFCKAIDVGPTKTQVSVMTFDKEQHPKFNFNTYHNKADVVNFMTNGVKYTSKTSGATCLVKAMDFTRQSIFTKARGARVDQNQASMAGMEQLVILMTDGCANCENKNDLTGKLVAVRKQFEERKIPVIAFFVGKNERCAKIMQDFANGAQCYQVFRALDFSEVDTMIQTISAGTCLDSWIIGPSCPA